LQPARERSPLPDGRVWKGQEQHFPPGQPGSVFLVAPHTMGVTAVAHAVSERNRVGAIVRSGPDRGLTAAMPFLVISGEDVQCEYKPLRGGTKCGKMLLAANAYRCARHARKHRMADERSSSAAMAAARAVVRRRSAAARSAPWRAAAAASATAPAPLEDDDDDEASNIRITRPTLTWKPKR
jgi:hypothetical protein